MGRDGDQPQVRAESIARVFIRPLGSVLPLGFLAFGVAVFVTASYSLGWIPLAQGGELFKLLVVFVVPVEAGTAILAYLSRDTAGGTTLGIFGATWAALGVVGMSLKPG